MSAKTSPVPSVRDRLCAAGISDDRIVEHAAAGRVRLDGKPVADLDQPAPAGTRDAVVGVTGPTREDPCCAQDPDPVPARP